MWATTGAILLSATASRKAPASPSVSGFVFQPRGFEVNIWKVVQVRSFARDTACASDPAMETWHPIEIMTVLNGSVSVG
jgi:hypothetical protein